MATISQDQYNDFVISLNCFANNIIQEIKSTCIDRIDILDYQLHYDKEDIQLLLESLGIEH